MLTVEWHCSAEETDLGRVLGIVAWAPVLGIAALLAGGVGVVLGLDALLAHRAVIVLVAVLALVGSLFSLRLFLSDSRQCVGPGTSGPGLGWRSLLIALFLGAAGQAAAYSLSPYGPLLTLGVATGGGFFATGLVSTAGCLDIETRTLSFTPDVFGARSSGREIDLTTWHSLRRYRLGDIVVLRPTYVEGYSGPRLLTVPAWVDERTESVFEAAVANGREPIERDPGRLVQATLVSFALLFGGLGVGLWLSGTVPTASQIPILLFAGGVGVVFLLVALREG